MYRAYIINDLEMTELYDPYSADAVLISDTFTESATSYEQWNFEIAPNNPAYGKMTKLKTRVVILEYDSDVYLFNGRVASCEENMDSNGNITQTVSCEGMPLVLNDSEQPHKQFSGTPLELIEYLLEVHNSQVEPWKQITVGEIEINTEYRVFYVPIEWETYPVYDNNGNPIGQTPVGTGVLSVGDTATIKQSAVYFNSYYHGSNLRIANFAKERPNTVATADSERNAYRLFYGTTPIGWINAADIYEAQASVGNDYTGETKPVVYSRQANLTAEISDGSNTLDVIRDLLLTRYGGYLIIDYHEGVPRLNIIRNPGEITNERLQLAVNLISMQQGDNPNDVVTVLRPVGYPPTEGGV